MIHILVEEPYTALVDEAAIEKAVAAALTHLGRQAEVGVTIQVDSDEMLQQLNRDFLGIDSPTDVLSFPSDEFDPDDQEDYIGDIILSYPRAEVQAKNAGHPVMNELQLLVVHGVLHLLGLDHAEPEEKTRMWAAQAEILATLGVKINQLPE